MRRNQAPNFSKTRIRNLELNSFPVSRSPLLLWRGSISRDTRTLLQQNKNKVNNNPKKIRNAIKKHIPLTRTVLRRLVVTFVLWGRESVQQIRSNLRVKSINKLIKSYLINCWPHPLNPNCQTITLLFSKLPVAQPPHTRLRFLLLVLAEWEAGRVGVECECWGCGCWGWKVTNCGRLSLTKFFFLWFDSPAVLFLFCGVGIVSNFEPGSLYGDTTTHIRLQFIEMIDQVVSRRNETNNGKIVTFLMRRYRADKISYQVKYVRDNLTTATIPYHHHELST